MSESTVNFHSPDGFGLEGTIRMPQRQIKHAVLLVHGITATRDEDGFYTELAQRLDEIHAGSLRFDLRCHGNSEGRQEELTLTGVINDIGSAIDEMRKCIPSPIPLSIIAASFGGGLSAYWASEHPNEIRTLVLLNPLLDYGSRMLCEKPFWKEGKLSDEGVKTLDKQGWLPHGEFKMGPDMISEIPRIKPYEKMVQLPIPVLTIHGDKDSMVPFETAQKYCSPKNNQSQFVPILGADHGFISPEDEECTHPDTIRFRNIVFEKILKWISDHK